MQKTKDEKLILYSATKLTTDLQAPGLGQANRECGGVKHLNWYNALTWNSTTQEQIVQTNKRKPNMISSNKRPMNYRLGIGISRM